jgi:type VI secretion system secreted protein Hcp
MAIEQKRSWVMFNAFANFGDIKGECTDKGHKDWVALIGFSHEIAQPASVSQKTAGGRSAEEVEVKPYRLRKLTDAATPKLIEATCKGTHIPEVTIHLVRAGGDPLTYYEVKLKEVLISRVVHDGDPKGEYQFPTESIDLTCGSFELTYTKQKPDGSAGGNVAAKWSLAEGAAA